MLAWNSVGPAPSYGIPDFKVCVCWGRSWARKIDAKLPKPVPALNNKSTCVVSQNPCSLSKPLANSLANFHYRIYQTLPRPRSRWLVGRGRVVGAVGALVVAFLATACGVGIVYKD